MIKAGSNYAVMASDGSRVGTIRGERYFEGNPEHPTYEVREDGFYQEAQRVAHFDGLAVVRASDQQRFDLIEQVD